MFIDWQRKRLALGALFACAVGLSGCTNSIADLPFIGTPADAPPRPKEQSAYLPVNDLPPNRDEGVMDPKERARIQAELSAARDRQAVSTPAKDTSGK
jgi:hypothetical protein